MDGTLLDSTMIWEGIAGEYLRTRGIQPRCGLNGTVKNMSLAQAASYLQAEYGLPDGADTIIRGVNRLMEQHYAEQVSPKAGALELLEELSRRQVKMCVATAADLHLARETLRRNGMLGYFKEVFTCTSVGHGKDRPDIYMAALHCLGTPKSSTWVFEDALYAIQTAKAAGFPVAGVYDPREPNTREVAKCSDVFLHSLDEMRRWLP